MQHVSVKSAPRRTLIWDEQNAQYIWLDPAAKTAAANLRAKRAADAIAADQSSGAYSSALGDLWDYRNYDGHTNRSTRQAKWRASRAARRSCHA